jgi:hypothetical protein
MGDKRNAHKILVRKLETKSSFDTLDLDMKIILERSLE